MNIINKIKNYFKKENKFYKLRQELWERQRREEKMKKEILDSFAEALLKKITK